jgi:hypothetical protein
MTGIEVSFRPAPFFVQEGAGGGGSGDRTKGSATLTTRLLSRRSPAACPKIGRSLKVSRSGNLPKAAPGTLSDSLPPQSVSDAVQFGLHASKALGVVGLRLGKAPQVLSHIP